MIATGRAVPSDRRGFALIEILIVILKEFGKQLPFMKKVEKKKIITSLNFLMAINGILLKVAIRDIQSRDYWQFSMRGVYILIKREV